MRTEPKMMAMMAVGAVLGAAGALAIREARADQESDVHRIAVATENIARELDGIERRLDRCTK